MGVIMLSGSKLILRNNIILFFLCSLSISPIIHATDRYDPFAMSREDIQVVLKSEIAIPVPSQQKLPADISYACADIKYKDGALKFCECGDGIYMSFRTAKVRINNRVQDIVSPYW